VSADGSETIPDVLLGIVQRHPLSDREVRRVVGEAKHETADRLLAAMEADGRFQTVDRGGERFWTVAAARFPRSSCSTDARGN
jgi:hypothetical protein